MQLHYLLAAAVVSDVSDVSHVIHVIHDLKPHT